MKIGYFPEMNIKNNVSSFLDEHAINNAEKIAFYYLSQKNISSGNFTHEQITYGEFNTKTARASGGFQRIGIKKGDRVIVFVPISVELYIVIGGLQRIGAIPVFLDSWSRKEHMAGAIQNAKPVGIVSVGKAFQLFSQALDAFKIKIRVSVDKCLVEDVFNLKELIKENECEIVPVDKEDTALITYTTGSSGTPKGANRTHRFLSAQHYVLKRLFPYKDKDIDLPVFPVFALNNIASGITTVIPAIDISRPMQNDSEVLYFQIKECEVNTMTLAPSSFRNMAVYCREKGALLDGITRVLTGGAPISETDIAQFIKVASSSENWILYGSTEVEPIAHIESKEMLRIKAPSNQGNITEVGVNVGKIDRELKHKLIEINKGAIDQDIDLGDIEVEKSEVGELIVAGEYVCREYYNNEEAFLRAKVKDKDGVVWHRTGDLARFDDKEYLWIVGRVHSVIEKDGEYFFPVRPEIMLKDLPNVTNSAYLSVDLDKKNQIVTVVSLEPGKVGLENKYRKKIEEIFKKKGIPLDKIFFIEDIPMDVRHHSKVDYEKLRQKLNDISK